MPPRDPALPEGTDHIIQGAAGSSSGSNAGGPSASAGGGSASGFVATGGAADTGGTAAGGNTGGSRSGTTGGGNGGSDGGSGGGSSTGTDRVREQIRSQVNNLRDQATEKARQFADDGKGRATTLLDDFGGVIDDAAKAIEDRFGPEYASYARRAAGSVNSLSQTLNSKDVDELLDDTRSAIRRSPGIAIGVAAVIGFALVRVLKTGMDDLSGGSRSDSSNSGGGA